MSYYDDFWEDDYSEYESFADAENNVPLDATPDSYEIFCEDAEEVDEDDN